MKKNYVTIEELINKLSTYPKDAIVRVYGGECGKGGVGDLAVGTIKTFDTGYKYFEAFSDDDYIMEYCDFDENANIMSQQPTRAKIKETCGNHDIKDYKA